ncbi:hypothetical protein BMS3Abin13_00552 [bacterium BMS3Abin13]|nr:hypothetical protein BMS3Abin13_00552 [bacterium BMS3Abin13]
MAGGTVAQEFAEGRQGLRAVDEPGDRGVDSLRIGGKDNPLVEITDHDFRAVQLVPDVGKLFFNRGAVADRHRVLDSGIGQGFHLLAEFGHPFPDLFPLVLNADADDRPHNQGHTDGEDDQDFQGQPFSDGIKEAEHVNGPRHG